MLNNSNPHVRYSHLNRKSILFPILIAMMGLLLFSLPATAQDSLNISKVGTLYDFWSETGNAHIIGDYIFAHNSPRNRILQLENNQLVEVECDPDAPFPSFTFHDSLGLYDNHIYNFADPPHPFQLGEIELEYHAYYIQSPTIFVRGNYLYNFFKERYPSENVLVDIYDIENLNNPTHITRYIFEEVLYHLDNCMFGNNYLILNHTYIYDFTDPVNPEFVCRLQDLNPPHHPIFPLANGDYLYWRESYPGHYMSIVVADASDPNNIEILTEIEPPPPGDWDNYIYWADYTENIHFFENGITWFGDVVVDFTNPLAPVVVGELDLENGKRKYSDDYIVTHDEALTLYSTDNLMNPEFLSSFNNHDEMKDMALVGKHAVLSCKTGIRIVSIQNPYQPEEVARLPLQNLSRGGMTVDGNLAYVARTHWEADFLPEIVLIDITNLNSPFIDSSIPLAPSADGGIVASELFIDEGYLYGSARHARAFAVNVETPGDPGEPSRFYDCYHGFIVVGEYAYSMTESGELTLYSNHPPDEPEFISLIDTTENRHYINLEREENLLYINYFSHPFNSMAVMVYDISIPDNPVQSGRIIQHEFAVDRWNVEDQHVYGEDREYDRFTIWDVENLDSVRISGFYPLKTTYIDSDVRGQYAFVIEQQSFEIYNISQALGVQEEDLIQPLPIAFEVHSPYPNPFNSTVTVPFTLNQPLIVSYTVRNILGQLVLEGKRHAQAGEHQFHLSLPAEIRASSGMYTIEVEAGGLQQTRRAVFVK